MTAHPISVAMLPPTLAAEDARLLAAISPDGERLYQIPSAGLKRLAAAGLIEVAAPTPDRSGWIRLTDPGRMQRAQILGSRR